VQAASVPIDDVLRLRVFVDHSVVEVFANGEACLSTRIYPTRPDSLSVEVFATGAGAELTELDAWRLDSIWPTRP
jgi:beta-fructofuranosidase